MPSTPPFRPVSYCLRSLLLPLTMLVLTTQGLHADGNHIFIGDGTIADAGTVSGYRGNRDPVIRQPGNGAVLYGIGGAEQGDNPCYIELLWSRQNASEHRLFTTEWHRGPCGARRTGSYEETRLSVPPPQAAITAIEVCTNKKKNRRLKAVKITGASEITEYAGRALGKIETKGEFKRANCGEWHKASRCSAKHVAVGVKIYNDEDGASGLELICGSAGLDPQQAEGVFTEPIPSGEVLQSPIAGTAGTKLRVEIGTGVDLPNAPLRYYGITSVLIVEDNDRPCRVAIYGGVLDPLKGPDGRLLGQAKVGNCLEFTITDLINPLSIGRGTKIDKLLPSVGHLEDHFVNGIQVCDSKTSNNHRIKGLGLHPARVDKWGGVRPWRSPSLLIPSQSKDRQKHCGAFGTTPRTEPKYCPDPNRMIAVGLVMHHDGASFTGIQLICRKVTAGFITPLKKDAHGY